MRLFIAVLLSDSVKADLLKLQEQLRSKADRGSFTRPENFHLTLAFLGETPESRLPVLHHVIGEIEHSPFEINFTKCGFFKHAQNEIWWAGADPSDPNLPELKSLHGKLVNGLEREGFPVDKRPFKAHITLGREIRHSKPIVLDKPEIKVRVDRISLMKSERIDGVLRYEEMHPPPFQKK